MKKKSYSERKNSIIFWAYIWKYGSTFFALFFPVFLVYIGFKIPITIPQYYIISLLLIPIFLIIIGICEIVGAVTETKLFHCVAQSMRHLHIENVNPNKKYWAKKEKRDMIFSGVVYIVVAVFLTIAFIVKYKNLI